MEKDQSTKSDNSTSTEDNKNNTPENIDQKKFEVSFENTSAKVNLLEEEYGIAPGQACVFYSKNNQGYKVLGGGWIRG